MSTIEENVSYLIIVGKTNPNEGGASFIHFIVTNTIEWGSTKLDLFEEVMRPILKKNNLPVHVLSTMDVWERIFKEQPIIQSAKKMRHESVDAFIIHIYQTLPEKVSQEIRSTFEPLYAQREAKLKEELSRYNT